MTAVASVPITASADNFIHKGGTINIEPFGDFAFNWSWWGLDEGISLSLYYTTNDPNSPIYFSINNTEYNIMEKYDYFFMYQWNRTDFPARAEVWWFTFSNIANTTITLEVAVHYNMPDPDAPTEPEPQIDYMVVMASILTIIVIFLGVVFRVRTGRRRA
jgi:hypothetical protein